jgi:CubicO group peptidase (beta-lactamase class C family)
MTEKVDALFTPWDKPDSPGCALAVVREGGIVYRRGYGLANLEYEVPITPATIFHVASVSKQFTAMAVILLAHEGKLSLDDDIRRHVPEVPDFGKAITLRHLIHHTSGLRDQWELLRLAGWRMDDVITEGDILSLVRRQQALNFAPGEEHLYCNTGYTLLALAVQRATGQSLRDYAEASLFRPLGMNHTHFHDDHCRIVKNRAYSYAPKKEDGYAHRPLAYANIGATSLFTTVEDLARWDRCFDEQRVGGRAVWEEMHRRGRLNSGKELDYASGLAHGEYRGLPTVGHGGGDAGFRSMFLRFPEQRFTVILFSNLASFDAGGMARQVADLYLDGEFKQPAPRPHPPSVGTRPRRAKVDPALFDAYAGDYRLSPGRLLTITREKSRLMAQATGDEKRQAIPSSETEFVVKDANARLTFDRPEGGQARRVVLRWGGQELPAERIERWQPEPEQMAEYAGDYYSEELGAVYSIEVRDGQLVLRHRRWEPALQPIIADEFGSELATITFTRGRGERVDGLMVDTGRIRKLRFAKAANGRIRLRSDT